MVIVSTTIVQVQARPPKLKCFLRSWLIYTPRPRVLLLPTVWSPKDKPLAWAGLAPAEEESRVYVTYGGEFQQLDNITIIAKAFTLKIFLARLFLQNNFHNEDE